MSVYTVSERCLVCGCEGILFSGIIIRGGFICGSCEKKLVSISCNDFFYDFYINGLKKIWRRAVV